MDYRDYIQCEKCDCKLIYDEYEGAVIKTWDY